MMAGQTVSGRVRILGKFVEVSKDTIRRDGKLLVFFMGAEYCPYCAAERWAIVRALQRFGRWMNAGKEGGRYVYPDVFARLLGYMHLTSAPH
jgi:thiol-disulfide isomerase/thioredoxin